VVIEAEEREGGVLAGWPRAPPPLFDAKQIGQGGGSRSRSPTGHKKRERRKAKLGHALTEFKFEFEISHTRFESLSKHSLEVSNMTKRSWPKFEFF
jgi:hypothetical protein